MKMSKIKLRCSDGEIAEVEVAIANFSHTLKTMLENVKNSNDDDVLDIPCVSTRILRKFIEWASHHNKSENPPVFNDIQPCSCTEGTVEIAIDYLSSWDTKFINDLDEETLFELTNVANYLHIKGLLDICTLTIANKIVGKTPQEIRLAFNIENDFTESEEELIREENAWFEEK